MILPAPTTWSAILVVEHSRHGILDMSSNRPFNMYTIEVDPDSDEVTVEATDDTAPQDTFRGRFKLDELLPTLRRLNRGLNRW